MRLTHAAHMRRHVCTHATPFPVRPISPPYPAQVIMRSIYEAASTAAKDYGVTLAEGANIAGFEKVAKAMLAQGAV